MIRVEVEYIQGGKKVAWVKVGTIPVDVTYIDGGPMRISKAAVRGAIKLLEDELQRFIDQVS